MLKASAVAPYKISSENACKVISKKVCAKY